ncbi:MAG TPA: FliH/SctL family protein [Terriglobia bacterium]|jgi:flagellar assembly protein FliH|nr:FliH/SctL family protein [Terriglobia bacterium]
MTPTWSNLTPSIKEPQVRPQPFVYRPVTKSKADAATCSSNLYAAGGVDPSGSGGEAVGIAGSVSEAEAKAREAQARELGIQEGEARARAEFEKQLSTLYENVAQALRDFSREREAYYQRVEEEVIRLALAIARKILHREAQLDPLLLAGVVRVALEKVSAGTTVRLRVHPDQVYAWHEFFSKQVDFGPTPELLGDASLGFGRCVLETALGSTDLTLESQLSEIEHGFFDLLAQRP